MLCLGIIYTNLAAHGLDDQAAFAEDLPEMDNVFGNKWGRRMVEMNIKALDQSAATHVFAAFDNTIDQNGTFLRDCHVVDPNLQEVFSWTTRKINAEHLWELGKKLVSQKFN